MAQRVERAGGVVIVAENGYLGAGGTSPKFDVHPGGPKPHHYYALARGYHNDFDTVKRGTSARFYALSVDIKPMRDGGEYVLICPNRPFGVPERMMHPDWAQRASERWKKTQPLPVRIRSHPGNDAPKHALAADLENAARVVVWSSSAGVHALIEGIPVTCEAPHWICKTDDRLTALHTMAWGQWTLSEIENGTAFRHVLSDA
jgi:hypothetical protein